jgi:hypothetical protein
MITLLTTLGLGALAPLLAAAGGWLTVIGGPLAGISGLIARKLPGGTLKLVLIGVAVLAAVIAIAGFTAHYEHLKNAASDLAALQPKIAALAQDLGCDGRDENERDLFACIPARDRDAAEAKAAALRKQQADMALALEFERRRADQNAAELADANAAIERSSAADDGPLPKVMRDNWARERARRGLK